MFAPPGRRAPRYAGPHRDDGRPREPQRRRRRRRALRGDAFPPLIASSPCASPCFAPETHPAMAHLLGGTASAHWQFDGFFHPGGADRASRSPATTRWRWGCASAETPSAAPLRDRAGFGGGRRPGVLAFFAVRLLEAGGGGSIRRGGAAAAGLLADVARPARGPPRSRRGDGAHSARSRRPGCGALSLDLHRRHFHLARQRARPSPAVARGPAGLGADRRAGARWYTGFAAVGVARLMHQRGRLATSASPWCSSSLAACSGRFPAGRGCSPTQPYSRPWRGGGSPQRQVSARTHARKCGSPRSPHPQPLPRGKGSIMPPKRSVHHDLSVLDLREQHPGHCDSAPAGTRASSGVAMSGPGHGPG